MTDLLTGQLVGIRKQAWLTKVNSGRTTAWQLPALRSQYLFRSTYFLWISVDQGYVSRLKLTLVEVFPFLFLFSPKIGKRAGST